MGKTNKGFSGLVKQLSSPRVGGLSGSKLLAVPDLVNQTQNNTEAQAKAPSSRDARALSMSAKNTPTGIRFGNPSSSGTRASRSSSSSLNLLRQTASGGIANAFTGGLGAVAGLGGLVSGIMSLFGGGSHNTLPPLVPFQLPQSQEQTVYVSSKGSTTFQGTNVEQSSLPTPTGNIPAASNPASLSGTGSQAFQIQSSQIAQAVKTALLNSSSLNDVIAEI